MADSAAFYRTFFQYDTLFKVTTSEEGQVNGIAEEPTLATEEAPVMLVNKPKAVVEPPQKVVAPTPAFVPPTPTFPALQHKILVLVDEPRQPDLLPAEALLLENILKATGHSAAHTDLLNFSYIPQADARTVLSEKSTNFFITFGVPLIRLQLDLLLPPYMPKQIEGIWFLLADSLPVIDADKALKKKLWQALQKMFL